MITTTFTALRKASACTEGYKKLAKHLGGIKNYGARTPIPVSEILTSNGLDDTLWTLAHACGDAGQRMCHLFACDAAERALHLYEDKYPGDMRPRRAIEVKRLWIDGKATDAERAAAWAAARAAAWDAANAWAAWAATVAARAAARAAAWDAANAWAARDAELEWQICHLKELLEESK